MTHAVARAHFLSPPEVPEGIFAQDTGEQGARTSRAWPNVSARPEEQLPPQASRRVQSSRHRVYILPNPESPPRLTTYSR